MFNAYEFTFAGKSSRMYGLMLYDFDGTGQDKVSFGSHASIVETRTKGRVSPVHFGVDYHSAPLSFKLVFGAEEPLDRYEMEVVSMWLTGYQDYQWLSIDQPDLERVQFRCLITQLTPLHHGWLPVAFEATVLCDCPYAYGYPFQHCYHIDGETDILFRNDSSTRAHIRPMLTYLQSSGDSLSIVNHSDGDRRFQLTGLPSPAHVEIDNENGIIRELMDGRDLYGGFDLDFFRLVQGDNALTVHGSGTLTISGRLLYNVAG